MHSHDTTIHFQTYTQAERKIVEAKKEALLKEASENAVLGSSLTSQLAELDSIKPRPYGTFQAVNNTCLKSFYVIIGSGVFNIITVLSSATLFSMPDMWTPINCT